MAESPNISSPAAPERINRWSEIDILDRTAPGSLIRTPTGDFITREQYAALPGRPMTVSERQAKIRQRVQEERAKMEREQRQRQEQEEEHERQMFARRSIERFLAGAALAEEDTAQDEPIEMQEQGAQAVEKGKSKVSERNLNYPEKLPY
ncbi:Hypothetical predicted protein [Lecanosticta acicola]|uniref:Uncharacterized protein n=1 Tax=Lecanosticta acicola TaxID=111012 RepID=A0AAI8YRQ8_9PEZI|nr:Hypothetical predicted protein [Lecanosticta acicola]